MPTLKLHYDGWIALPAEIRRSLGLSSGDRVDADLVDGALVLRPAGKKARSAAALNAGDHAPARSGSETLRLVEEPSILKKTRRTPKRAGESAPARKRRGRPPKVAAGVEAPRAQANPVVGIGPAKLIKKAELAAKVVPQEAESPIPAARIRPERVSQPVERRPFRNVEIRTLGPGRGHNRSRRIPLGSTV